MTFPITKPKLRWAITGLGLQAEKIAQAINSTHDSKLIAVADKDLKRAKNFAQRHKAKYYFNSYKKLLKNPEIETVFVASPNYQHKTQTILALEAKKHVLCEKPMALSLKDGLAMLRSAKKNKVKIGIGFHLRYHPIHQEARRLIGSGRLGRIILIEAHWSVGRLGETRLSPYQGYMRWRNNLKKSGGGTLMARGIHLFDLLRFLTDQEVNEITAYTDASKKQPLDTTMICLVRLGKTFATLATSRIIPQSIDDVIIYGSHGRLILHNALTTDASGILEFTSGKIKFERRFKKMNVYQKEIEGFANEIHRKKGGGAKGEDGVKSIAITEGFIAAVKDKKSKKIKRIKIYLEK